MNISDFIPVNERKRLKNKLLIRHFVISPIVISFGVYLYSSLSQDEFVDLNILLNMGAIVLVVTSILWILTNTDNDIKREKRQEIKKHNKSKKRIAVEYVLFILLLIAFAVYEWKY
ncbi:hypothetical protein [Lentibacillus kimchii]|uniref:DUF2178 domain-containing protein n=1 Tax=Lentibacillus kimchii TaxID=1542911 RepID=A0ABW2UUU1_9BACI